MMRMLYDDINGVYVWVDNLDEDVKLSPHFDYEEDAIQWYNTLLNVFRKGMNDE